jgi:hypothetical protein
LIRIKLLPDKLKAHRSPIDRERLTLPTIRRRHFSNARNNKRIAQAEYNKRNERELKTDNPMIFHIELIKL